MKKLCKLVYNEDGWQKPSGISKWDPNLRKKDGIPFEKRYGYGHEEWLFSPLFNIQGYQYGFIEGLEPRRIGEVTLVDEVHLFTIDLKTKNRIYLGFLKNVEINNFKMPSELIVNAKLKKIQQQMIQDLIEVNADPIIIKKYPPKPLIRFKLKDINLLNTPILVKNKSFISKYNRCTPYNFNDDLKKIIAGEQTKDNGINIISGKAILSEQKTIKNQRKSETSVSVFHKQISNKLSKFLENTKVEKIKSLSQERTQIDRKTMDMIIEEKNNELTIFEIKTSLDIRLNIRESIGQLLDYALWLNDRRKINICIVSPIKPDPGTLLYLKRLKSNIKLNMSYLFFNNDAKTIIDSFQYIDL
jgi:hypothetical protein